MRFDIPMAAVIPTLDAAVLEVLAGGDEWFTISQLSGIAPAGSAAGLRLALLRLAENGIVHRERVGRSDRYRLNREHLAAEPIVALARMRERLYERLRECVATWPTPPVAVAVLGSVARGQAGTGSDLDLLVVTRGEDFDDVTSDLERAATLWTGNVAHAVILTEEQVWDPDGAIFLQEVARDAVVVFGENSYLRRQPRVRS